VSKSPELLLVDMRDHVVFANDEALSALQLGQQDQSSGCTNASVMQDLQNLIARFAANDKIPDQFTFAGFAWHSIRFALPNGTEPNGTEPKMMSAFVIGSCKASQSPATTFGRMFRLTPRETEALELFMRGLSVKETAAQMKISSSTAKAFLRLITIKMGVSGRAEMMSKLLNYMCPASLTCPFRTSLPVQPRSSPKD
jgi:DNA-binding CsgD family transcriptional regulator